MPIEPEQLKVSLNERDTVTALLYSAPRKNRGRTTVLLGHGAGANQSSPFMRLFASGLAERGMDAMTFDFLYMEQGRRAPDPNAKLEHCYRAVMSAAQSHKKLKGNQLVIGGKSMGGRIASQVAAQVNDDALADGRAPAPVLSDAGRAVVSGLVFLGYPLHPPGKPDQLRDKHLRNIHAPMLFVQGSRDAFGSADEIVSVIKRLKLPATPYIIEGGDHSLKAPKSSGLTQSQIYEAVMDEICRWLKVI